MKKTLVFGASPNPSRYSYLATNRLADSGHEVVPVGIRNGSIEGKDIIVGHPEVEDVDTITMYVGMQNQAEHYDYLLGLNPKRIIFNLGTENPEFERMANSKGIETEIACTLVLLSLGAY